MFKNGLMIMAVIVCTPVDVPVPPTPIDAPKPIVIKG